MASLQALYRSLNEYQRFKSSLEDILANLKNSLEPLDQASKHLQETFLYDDYSADNKKITSNRSKVNDMIVTVEQVVLPEVNRKISSINRQIADEEMAQALNANI